MTTQFISRVQRSPERFIDESPAPGSYPHDPDTIKSKMGKPSFVGFATSSKREQVGKSNEVPPPGRYKLHDQFSINIEKNSGSSFKSETERFTVDDPSDKDGGSYTLGSTLNLKNKKKFAKPVTGVIEKLGYAPTVNSVPSIPARNQSYGYEPEEKTGRLVLQQPLIAGFSGRGNDTVGPGDYEPNIDIKYRSSGTISFGIGDRQTLSSKDIQMPGPGYYNIMSDFDVINNHSSNSESNLILRLQAAKAKSSASFESKTSRDSIFKDSLKNIQGPGPGKYEIPSSIKVKTKPVEKQFFSSCEKRFKDDYPSSMRLSTAPGTYNIKSEFESNKLKILRDLQLRKYADAKVGFTGAEERFRDTDKINVPPPGTYRPKNEFIDMLPKKNKRSGPFGTSTKRFEETKPLYMAPDKNPFDDDNHGNNNNKRSATVSLSKPRYSSVFASHGRRFESSTSDGPPPGTYNVIESMLNKPCGAVMIPSVGSSRVKRSDRSPGPMDYTLPSTLEHKKPNRKNIMMSSSKRIPDHVNNDTPNPGTYNPTPIYGSFILKSHNTLLMQ